MFILISIVIFGLAFGATLVWWFVEGVISVPFTGHTTNAPFRRGLFWTLVLIFYLAHFYSLAKW